MAILNSSINAKRPKRKATSHRRAHEYCTLERLDGVKNALGERPDVWSPLGERYGQIQPINGREYFSQPGELSEVTTRIRFRYDSLTSGLAPNDRITHSGINYNIKSIIDPDLAHKEIIAMCTHDPIN